MAPLGSKRRRQDAQAAATGEIQGSSSGESDGVALDFLSELDALLGDAQDGEMLGLLDSPWSRDSQRQVRRKTATLKPILPGPSLLSTPVLKSKPKSSTQRQKEELQFLRGRATDLQTELDRIKQRQQVEIEADKASPDSLEFAGGGDLGATGLWRSIAESQREERSKAEKENARLVASVQAQIRLARSLEKLLSKPQVWDQLQEDHWRKGEQISKSDSEWFGDLVRSIESRHPLFESILNSNGLHRAALEVDEIKLKYATDDGLMIENKMAKVLPFDFGMCNRVLWRALRQGKINVYNFPMSIIEETDDVVLLKLNVSCSPIIGRPVTIYQAFKRYIGDNEITIITEVAAMTTEMSGPAPALQVIGQGWGRIAPSALPDGSFGTNLQVFTTSILTLLEPASPSRDETEGHNEIGMLSQLIMSAMREKKQLTRQLIENLLLDAALSSV